MSKKSEASTEIALYLGPFKDNNFDLLQDEVWFQTVTDEEISKLLKSKSGDGIGKPEMTYKLGPNDILVLEVKKDKKDHSSIIGGCPLGYLDFIPNKIKEKAEDGVINYMQGLSKEYNVIGVAASGQPNGSYEISNFRAKKGGRIEKLEHRQILDIKKYRALLDKLYSPKETPIEIREFGEWLHDHLRTEMKLSEADKPILVSGVLVALQDQAYFRNYSSYDKDDLQEQTLTAIRNVLKRRTSRAQSQVEKIEIMMDAYKAVFNKAAIKIGLRRVIVELHRNLHNADHENSSFDLLGHFYGEFLKYTGGDKKGLGIVLTPNHITSLFARLTDIKYGDCIFDPCAGTAGFLIAVMAQLTTTYKDDQKKLDSIYRNALMGIEFNENNYTLACANMLLRGDGKSNIKHGDCFDPIFDGLSSVEFGKPNKTLLNPPYAQDTIHELDFVQRACDLTDKDGFVIAIIPMSCVCEQNLAVVTKRAELLKNNSLVAVMSMPDGLFPKVGVVTCTMILKAGIPHAHDTYTWFASWKNDGFKLNKNVRYESQPWWDCEQKTPEDVNLITDLHLKERLAKVDNWVYPANSWQPLDEKNIEWIKSNKIRKIKGVSKIEGTETQFVSDYNNRIVKSQYSVNVRLFDKAEEMKNISILNDSKESSIKEAHKKNDYWSPAYLEWCAEAYLETDMTAIDDSFLKERVKDYAFHLLQLSKIEDCAALSFVADNMILPQNISLKKFKITDMGNLKKGERFVSKDMILGNIPYVGASEYGNGITQRVSSDDEHTLHKAGKITIPYDGSIGYAFLQPESFYVGDQCNILYPFTDDVLANLYICAAIRRERYRYNYGRKWHLDRMRFSTIILPEKNGKPDYDMMNKIMCPIVKEFEIDTQNFLKKMFPKTTL